MVLQVLLGKKKVFYYNHITHKLLHFAYKDRFELLSRFRYDNTGVYRTIVRSNTFLGI